MKILVSACLLGDKVRYDGRDKLCSDGILQRWIREGRVVTVCPEIAGGLSVPRPPAEIAGGGGGAAVLDGTSRVKDVHGRDVSAEFIAGSNVALRSAEENAIRLAVLKEGSPSCGSSFSYDGTFTGMRVPQAGVTTARLEAAGIRVFSETQLEEADALLRQLESATSIDRSRAPQR